MATSFSFSIILTEKSAEQTIALARSQGLGLEVQAFVGGSALNRSSNRQGLEDSLAEKLTAFPECLSFHGAFLDLSLHSCDQEIARISRQRIERDIRTAVRLGCEKIIFHLGYNPLTETLKQRQDLLAIHTLFWEEMLAEYPDITFCLENVWETDWSLFGELFEAIEHPRLGLCLDVAHAHLHSHFAPEAWIGRMATQVNHMHWSDNFGDRDSHLAVGKGNIRWDRIIEACQGWATMQVLLEVGDRTKAQSSLDYLRRQGLDVPFSGEQYRRDGFSPSLVSAG